jgi:hypothetical protein
VSVTRHGVKYSKVLSRGSRWGGPKVHIARWSRVSRGWEPVCRPMPEDDGHRHWFIGAGYPTVDDDEPATCKKCLAKRDRL